MVDHSSRGELRPEPECEDGTDGRPWRDAARDQIRCRCVARPADDQLPEEHPLRLFRGKSGPAD